MKKRLRGVFAPVLTPFTKDLAIDTSRFIAHCRWLVANNAGLTIFGTNSEAASLSVEERIALTDALLAAGIPAASLMPGTGACALPDAVTLTRHAVKSGAQGVLMLPPFYYKGVSDDGIYAYYSEVIERVGDDRLAIYLYHIPQMTQVPITIALVERLLKKYPGTVAGAKDSSGVWENTRTLIQSFGADGFDVFPGSESFLSQAMAIGGAGCISATVNVNPAAIRAIFDGWNGREGAALQRKADVIRQIFQAAPLVPAMKTAVAQFSGDADWAIVRPPLTQLADPTRNTLLEQLSSVGFAMKGYPKS